MNFKINSKSNLYQVVNANRQVKNRQNNVSNNMDFTSMGTIRDAIISEKASEKINSKLYDNNTGEPLYEEKLTWYGIDITDNPHAHKVIVPLPDDVKEKIFENLKKSYEETGRKPKNDVSTIEEFYDFCDKTVSSKKGLDKLKTSWTMSQYRSEVSDIIESKIRKLDPKWDWGQPVKREVLGKIFGAKLDIYI